MHLVFDHLEKRPETYEFLSLFEYLLIDRDSEFGDPKALEVSLIIDGIWNLYVENRIIQAKF